MIIKSCFLYNPIKFLAILYSSESRGWGLGIVTRSYCKYDSKEQTNAFEKGDKSLTEKLACNTGVLTGQLTSFKVLLLFITLL